MTSATISDGPARVDQQDQGPLFSGKVPMSTQKATQVVVALAQARAEDTEEGEALRVILREVKAQREMGLRMERAIHDLVKQLEALEAEQAKRTAG